jgi:PAS domain S-box-containing protein
MCTVNEISKISQHLSMALEAAKMVIWEWDLLTNCIVWSSSQEELFGLAPGSFPETYESAIARVHPSDLEAVTLSLNQARVERHDYHQELRIFGSDGSIHWIEAKGRFFYNDERQAVRMVGTVMEISDRKAKEEQLRLLESVVLHTNDSVLITEAEPTEPTDSRIIYANPAFSQLTGYTLEEVLGKTPYIFVGEKTDPAAVDKIRTARQNWQPLQVDLIHPIKDGRDLWIELNIFPVPDETGRVTHWVSVARDISERKQTEAALKESEERFRQIAENIQDVFWILDPQKRQIVYISPVYERIWGRKCESLYATRTNWMNSIHPDDREKVQAVLGDKVHTELFEHEYRIVRPDGTVRWIRDRGFPVKDEFGQVQRITGIAEDITEQKLSEVALRESEERFRQIAENIEDVFWISDPTKPQLLYISPAYEKIWGRSIESLYASNINLINSTHPDDREAVLATFVEKAHLGVFEHEYRIVRPDGTVRWIRDRGFPVKDEGQLKYITGIAQDITERKLAEAALQQLNEELEIRIKQRTLELERSQLILQQQLRREQLIKRLTQQIRQSLDLEIILNTVVTEVQKLLASDRVLVYQIQPDGTGSIVAEAVVGDWTKILHQKFPEEAFPKQSQKQYLKGRIDTITNRDIEEISPCFADFLAEIQVRAELVVPIIQQDTVWGLLIVHQCSEPREWQTREIDLLKQLSSQVAIAIQQSELYQQLKEELRDRTSAEVALRQSEALFRSLSDSAPIGIFRCDPHGKVIYTNPYCQAICGYPFEEALGDGWMQFIHPEDLQVMLHQCFASVAAKHEFYSEVRHVHGDGTIRLCRIKTVPIFSEPTEIIGYVGVLEDITQSRAIEKMKKEFISIVSHELRTPLTAIRGSLGLLAAGVLKDQPDTAKQMLEIAAKDTERLVRLVNDILDSERLEANKVFLVKQWCDAATLMHQSVESVQFLAAQNNITLCVVPSKVQVWADSDWMIQTLVNLLSNAIKFSPSESTVTLSVQGLPDHVLFKVQDQGRGIPHDQLETIFRRFQQVDASDSRQKGGTGLGLAICRSIVQQHGGRIWAESVLGLGTVFYFTLPQPLDSEGC